MTKEDLRIVFLGTPEFAVESLKALVENNYNIVGVVTTPDRKSGRGQRIQYSAVKEYALEKNLPVLQPDKLRDEKFLEALKEWKADLQIVVAFRMLPELVWDMPRLGTFNLHASLLPQYRGAAPINWAIINGEKKTGATTFLLVHEIDKGNILLQEELSIGKNDNAGYIHDKLMFIGAKLVCKTVDKIISDEFIEIPQKKLVEKLKELKPAPKIFRETCEINWNLEALSIHNLVRGMSPYPVAWTKLINGEEEIDNLKIHETEIIESSHKLEVGTIQTDNQTYIHVATADGHTISILKLQLPGRRAMATADLLRGFQIEDNSYFK